MLLPDTQGAPRPDSTQNKYGMIAMLKDQFPTQCEPTMGIEVELWIVSKRTGRPLPLYDAIFAALPTELQQRTNPEFLACQIEYATAAHLHPREHRRELQKFLRYITAAADKRGAKLLWKASHPTWRFDPKMASTCERARMNLQRFGSRLQNLCLCSTHIHVAVPQDRAIQVLDAMQGFVPLLVALTANSAEMAGQSNGVCSQRVARWAFDFPTSGFPRQFGDWQGYMDHAERMQRFGHIESQKDMYYFLRGTRFGTCEVRCCDLPCDLESVIAVGTLVQSLMVRLQRMPALTLPFDMLHTDLINAITHGLEAELLSPCGELTKLPVSECLKKLIEELRPVSREIGTEDELDGVYATLIEARQPTLAARAPYPHWQAFYTAAATAAAIMCTTAAAWWNFL